MVYKIILLLFQWCTRLLLLIYIADYLAALFNTMVNTPRKELDDLRKELKKETPEALHTMLSEKEDKSKAKEKFLSRKGKRTPICPPTCSGTAYQDYSVGLEA